MCNRELAVQFLDAIQSGNVAAIRRLVAEHPKLLHYDDDMTWLHYAADYNGAAAVEVLVELGCDPNAERDVSSRDRPLFGALVNDDPATVEALLRHGAAPNRGRPAITAVTGDNRHSLELIKLLEAYGADLHKPFPFAGGHVVNALSMAIDYGKDDVVEYLRSKGCVLPEKSKEVVEAEVIDTDDDIVEAEAVPDDLSDEVVAYFREHFGPVDLVAQIEIVPTGPPIAIHVIPPAEDRNHVTLFTTGMSAQPMTVPATEDGREYQRAELFMQLPGDWKYRALGDPHFGWPFYWLRSLAQHPQVNDTWLGGPVALVANGDPPEPLAPNTRLTTLMLLAEHHFTSREGHKIWLYRMTPLYTEERQLEIDEGIAALMQAFDRHSSPFIIDLNRPNVAQSK